MLVDTTYQGTFRKLIIAADSNGFLDIFDRETGKFLGQRNSDSMKSSEDTCPEEKLSPSWNPPSYNEQTHTFYFMSLEDCRARPISAHCNTPSAGSED